MGFSRAILGTRGDDVGRPGRPGDLAIPPNARGSSNVYMVFALDRDDSIGIMRTVVGGPFSRFQPRVTWRRRLDVVVRVKGSMPG